MEMTKFLDLPGKLDETAVIPGDPGILLWIALALLVYKLVLSIGERRRHQVRCRLASENNISLVSITENMIGLESRMSRIDHHMETMIKRIEQLQLAHHNKADLQQARQLVRDGASTNQIVELCGLSRGEAELFQRLHV